MHYPYNFYIPYSQNDKNTNSDKNCIIANLLIATFSIQFKITTSFLNDEKINLKYLQKI